MNKPESAADRYRTNSNESSLDFANGASFWKELWKEAKANWQTLSIEKKVGLTAVSLAIAGVTALGGKNAEDIQPEVGSAISLVTGADGNVRYVDPVYGPEAPLPGAEPQIVAKNPAIPGNDGAAATNIERESKP